MYSRYFIVQTPIFWMAPPWQFKRYQDVVFNTRAFIYGDGRESDAPDDGYGTSGLLVDRSYMLSITCNAPLAAFDRPHDFFEGRGADGLLMPVHKSLLPRTSAAGILQAQALVLIPTDRRTVRDPDPAAAGGAAAAAAV